jgi:hypothetical protein
MNRTDLILQIAEATGVPADHGAPGMIALRAAIDNPANKTVAAALTEMAEEMAFTNKLYRKLYEVAAATPLDEAIEPAEPSA